MSKAVLRITMVAAFLAAACNLSGAPAADTSAPISGGPKIQFTDPQNEASLQMGAQKIILHAEDARGVARAEFRVNGKLAGAQESPDPQKIAVNFTFAWEPSAPDTYILQARAQNADGVWGPDVMITVHVEKRRASADSTSGATAKPGEAPTKEPSPTATHTATVASTPTLTLSPTSQAVTFAPDVNPKLFYKHGSGCDPTVLYLNVGVTGNVFSVVVFLRVYNFDTYEPISDWNSGIAMTPQGGGRFALTLNSTHFPPPLPFVSARAGYQFVATDKSGGTLARSQVYYDVTLQAGC
jgi:hypothetical protein